MTKTTDIRIAEASGSRESFAYRVPIKFGGRVVQEVQVQRCILAVVAKGGRKRSYGIGEMTLGTAWAWPSKLVPAELVTRVVATLSDRLIAAAPSWDLTGHPLDFGLHLQREAKSMAKDLQEQLKLPEPIPELAILLAASPIDAAVHDAFGRLHGVSSFDIFKPEFLDGDLSRWLGDEFAGVGWEGKVLSKPKPTLSLYHLVGALDPLSSGELSKPVGDGLPETLEEWIRREGLSHLKIKLSGTDLDWDVGRVVEVDRIATAESSTREWRYSLDFNECCADEDYVIDFLERVDRLSRSIHARLQYIEQPTSRHLSVKKGMTMHRVGRLKPVVIDESLIDLESLQLARKLGYSGIALKACKGQTESLLMAAAAQHYGMFVAVQDLTCIGASFLHSASLAAHLPKVAVVEGNGRQYCPAGNQLWEAKYRPMFRIRGGVVPTELLEGVGLGYQWPPEMLQEETKGHGWK